MRIKVWICYHLYLMKRPNGHNGAIGYNYRNAITNPDLLFLLKIQDCASLPNVLYSTERIRKDIHLFYSCRCITGLLNNMFTKRASGLQSNH